jgi:cholesterol transport system auxiliary component
MTPLHTTAVFACLTMILPTAGGCLDLKKSYPEKRSFVLDVGAPQEKARSHNAIVLKMNKFRISPLFAGRAMVYRVAALEYETDFYDEWFIAPATLVTQQVQAWLSRSAGFSLVILGTNHVEPTHVLEGMVTDFYGDFRGAPRAVFGLDLQVLDARHERQLLFSRSYRQDVALTDRSSDALARGLTEALRVVLMDVTKDLAEVEAARNAAHP